MPYDDARFQDVRAWLACAELVKEMVLTDLALKGVRFEG